MISILDDTLMDNSIRETLLDLVPQQQGYEHLKERLGHYRDLAANGDWPTITLNMYFRKGAKHAAVTKINKRLLLSGDLKMT
jgi:murein L,D-transpeptidase YcbB/YkuD